MKIALIQSDLYWEDASKNRISFESKINQIDSGVNLVVLPEMFSTGFTMNAPAVAETMQGETVLWMQNLAKQKNFGITGSLIIVENEQYYNRMLFVFPSGEIQFYNKRHLFSLAGEDKAFTSGTEKVIVEYLGWRICLQICYDLRFPVFSRNIENYDLLIYIASWPKIRTNAWDALLKARAIENLSYVVGVNRIGVDAHNFVHIGHSQIIDSLGNFVVEPQESESVFIAELDKDEMTQIRNKLNFLSDKDDFEIKIS
jgi:predicted amidohydrolase